MSQYNRMSKVILVVLICLVIATVFSFDYEKDYLEKDLKCVRAICSNTAEGLRCSVSEPYVYGMVYNRKTLELQLIKLNRCENGLP